MFPHNCLKMRSDMAKLSVKGLIESSLKAGHTLDSDHQPLEQFFIIIEYVLRHGLKSKRRVAVSVLTYIQ